MRHLSLALLVAGMATPIAAQQGEDTTGSQQQWGPVDSRDGTYLQSPVDVDVVTGDGEKIGEIAEILIGEDGQPAAFVVEVGGFLDIGDDEVAVPIEALTYAENRYVSKMTEQQLENLPKWDD